MYANRLILAAVALTLAACGDQNTTALSGPTPAGRIVPSVPTLQRLRGVVVSEHRFGAPALQTESGLIEMQGYAANLMASVDGAEVMVEGTYDGAGGVLLVARFEVVGMRGRPAVDGVLEEYETGAFAIVLASGELHWINDPPEELKAITGRRIWLTERAGDTPIEFGEIRNIDRFM